MWHIWGRREFVGKHKGEDHLDGEESLWENIREKTTWMEGDLGIHRRIILE
jgi:hypothetical protein